MCISALNQEFIERKKHFDEIFGTDTLHNINFDNLPLLKAIFEYIDDDMYRPSAKYQELRKKSIEISNQLEQTFTKEQKSIFEEYWEVQNRMVSEEEEQLFFFGFIMAKALEKEMNLISKKEN